VQPGRTALALPMHPNLTRAEIERVVAVATEALASRAVG